VKRRIDGHMVFLPRPHLGRGFAVRNGAAQRQEVGRHRAEHECRIVVDLVGGCGVPEEVHPPSLLATPSPVILCPRYREEVPQESESRKEE
jgi:hypothetical protein